MIAVKNILCIMHNQYSIPVRLGTCVSLKELRILTLVAQIRSLSKVATLLDVSQPTISRHIASLEREFGLTLVDHGSRPIRLTVEGARLAGLCQVFLSDSEHLNTSSSDSVDESPLVVAAPLVVASGLLPPVLLIHRNAFPKS